MKSNFFHHRRLACKALSLQPGCSHRYPPGIPGFCGVDPQRDVQPSRFVFGPGILPGGQHRTIHLWVVDGRNRVHHTRAGWFVDGCLGCGARPGPGSRGMLSGGLVDLVRGFGGNAITAYGLVFALEALLLLFALGLLRRIKITQARVISRSQGAEM
jgi:hypothetical protein